MDGLQGPLDQLVAAGAPGAAALVIDRASLWQVGTASQSAASAAASLVAGGDILAVVLVMIAMRSRMQWRPLCLNS
jgi:hypothetical protein